MPAFCASWRKNGEARKLCTGQVICLVKLQRRHRDMVKKGQKLKKGSFFLIKTLTLEMAPNDMLQETRKKN